MSFYVYMLRCADGTLYTGYTDDPERRARVHNAGKGAKYTRSRLPVELVYREALGDKSAALRRERELKRLTRKQKLAPVSYTHLDVYKRQVHTLAIGSYFLRW